MHRDTLCEIFIHFIGDGITALYNINRFMLVCREWYEVTCSDGFWSTLMKKMIQEEMLLIQQPDLKLRFDEYKGRYEKPRRSCIFNRPKNYSKYLSRLLEKVNLNNLVYKELTRKLFEKRNWYRIQTEIENLAMNPQDRYGEAVENWQTILNYLEKKPFGKTPKEICQFKIYDRYLIEHLAISSLYDSTDEYFRILVEKYESWILPFLKHSYLAEYQIPFEKHTLLSYALKDIETTQGKIIPPDILIYAFRDNFFSEDNLDQLIVALKKYRQRDFRPKFLNRLFSIFKGQELSMSRMNFAKKVIYLMNKLQVQKWKDFNPSDVSRCIFNFVVYSHQQLYDSIGYIEKELEQLAEMGCGKYFNELPDSIVALKGDSLNLLKLIFNQGIDPKEYPNLLNETLKNSGSGDKVPTLKYLIEECNLEFNGPVDSLNKFTCPPEDYLENLEYLASRFNIKLTNIDTFVHSLDSGVRLSTLEKIFTHVTEKYKVNIVSDCLSRVYYDWQRIAATEDANLETQKRALRYFEAKFPHARI